jgi:ketosteroid isomerase-like protein
MLLGPCGFFEKLGGDSMGPTTDTNTLERLNEDYIRAYMTADVNWYEEHLADDFVCIESDGTVLNKIQFLSNVANGPDVAEYKLEEVRVRIYGSVALVQATGLFTRKDGATGVSRYTDVYAQTGEGWKAVSAQITRRTSALNASSAN